MYDRDPVLSEEQAAIRDEVVEIMHRIANVTEYGAMNEPVFAAWMLGCISATVKTALSCRVPERGWYESVREIRDDVERLRQVSHHIDAETISLFVPKPAS